jgi:hypothetical protein
MKLFLISQTANQGYDTYDSAVVAAPNEEAARRMNPAAPDGTPFAGGPSCWASPDKVSVKLIGTAITGTETGVICASYNAG